MFCEQTRHRVNKSESILCKPKRKKHLESYANDFVFCIIALDWVKISTNVLMLKHIAGTCLCRPWYILYVLQVKLATLLLIQSVQRHSFVCKGKSSTMKHHEEKHRVVTENHLQVTCHIVIHSCQLPLHGISPPTYTYFPLLIMSGRFIPGLLVQACKPHPYGSILLCLQRQCTADKQPRLPAGHLFLWA